MRLSRTKGRQAADVPTCARCKRQHVLDPCRDCATPDELGVYPCPICYAPVSKHLGGVCP